MENAVSSEKYIFINNDGLWTSRKQYVEQERWTNELQKRRLALPFVTNINFQDSLPNTDLYELTPMKLIEDLFSNLTEISRTSQSL